MAFDLAFEVATLMASSVRFSKFVLPGIVLLFSIHHSHAQLTFSYSRNYISQETFCVPLENKRNYEGDDVLREITRFGEEPLSSTNKNVFRVIDYDDRTDIRRITIRKIEKVDTVCLVTIKTIKNPRKGIVFVHQKKYSLDKWEDFQRLVKRYFRQDSKYSSVKIYYPEGWYQRYELSEAGNYQVLSERQTGSNGMVLRDYLEYLLSPIFEEECLVTARKRSAKRSAEGN